MILLTITSLASASATARPNELASRELGPYDLRVQGDSFEEADSLRRLGLSSGAVAADLISTSPAILTTSKSAISITLESGRVDPALLSSRFQILSGTESATANTIMLTRDVATALGVRAGDTVEWSGQQLKIAAVVLQRSNYNYRAGLMAGADAQRPAPNASTENHVNVYLQVAPGAGELNVVADAFQRRGYGVLGRLSGADDLTANDGEFVQLLQRVSWVFLALSLLTVAAATGVVSRMVEGELRTLFLLGFNRRSRSLLAAFLGLTCALCASALGIAIGIVLADRSRPAFERLNGSEWYGSRVSARYLLICAVLIAVVAAGSAFLRSRALSIIEEQTVPRRHSTASAARRVFTFTTLAGTLLGVAAIASGKWTYLLFVAILVAPGVALGVWFLIQARWQAAGLKRQYTTSRLLVTSYVRDRVDVVAAGSAIAAALLAFPLAAVLMISGLNGDATNTTSEVPRANLAIYNGPPTLRVSDISTLAQESGAQRAFSWNLGLRPAGTSGDLATAWIPAMAATAGRACPTGGGSAAGPNSDRLCSEGLRGVALASDSTIGMIFGRNLSDAEKRVLARGGALSLDPDLLQGSRMKIMPTSGMALPAAAAGEVDVAALAVRPAPGTAISSTLPVVWLSDRVSAAGSPATTFKRGQVEAAFQFQRAVTPDLEMGLRRAIVQRVEVGSTEEFLVTHLTATRVNLVQRILSNTFWVALLLAAAAASYTGLALRQSQGIAERVLRDLGAASGMLASWRAALVSASTVVGATAAAVTAAICGALVVHGETGQNVPLSGWLRLLPLVAIPLITALIGVMTTWRWRTGLRADSFGLGEGSLIPHRAKERPDV